MPKPPDTVDLLFLSLEPWDDIWRRNQFLCAEYTRRHPEAKILYVTPPRDLTNALRRQEFRRLRTEPVWSPPEFPGIHVLKPTKFAPNTLELGRRANVASLRRQIRRALRGLSMTHPLLWVNDHSAADLLGTLDEAASVYDITDDWIAFDQPKFVQRRIARQDDRLCRGASAVIVCSEGLYRMKQPLAAARLHLIPNGVEVEHYAAVLDPAAALPPAAAAWKPPVLGYTGSVHGQRVDLELVGALARATAGTVVLVGPNMLTAAETARLRALPNVVLHGPVAYRELPAYMRAFNVCIVPHRVSAFTESLNPLKLWEYLAAGKPIVATPVAGFRDYPELVYLADGAPDFARQIARALSEDPALAAKRREEAQKHSWSRRFDAVERALAQVRPGPAPIPEAH